MNISKQVNLPSLLTEKEKEQFEKNLKNKAEYVGKDKMKISEALNAQNIISIRANQKKIMRNKSLKKK